jgi:hypothetical protein
VEKNNINVDFDLDGERLSGSADQYLNVVRSKERGTESKTSSLNSFLSNIHKFIGFSTANTPLFANPFTGRKSQWRDDGLYETQFFCFL